MSTSSDLSVTERLTVDDRTAAFKAITDALGKSQREIVHEEIRK